MRYEKTDWQNSPSTSTPIDAARLNKIEGALDSALNRQELNFAYNEDWQAGSGIGSQFNRIGNLVISTFSAALTSVDGMHLFLGTIPEGRRPTATMTFPAAFVPTGDTVYEARMLVVRPDGIIQIANTPSTTGTFFCTIVYFVDDVVPTEVGA